MVIQKGGQVFRFSKKNETVREHPPKWILRGKGWKVGTRRLGTIGGVRGGLHGTLRLKTP